LGTFQRTWPWTVPLVMGRPGQGIDPFGSENKSKPMNDTQTSVHYRKPPRPVRILANAIATTILRSPWHRMRSDRLLLLTFTGRKSGKAFTTPLRYVQEGETLRLLVVRSPWWKNLVGEAAVHVLLRGQMRTGTAEVLPEEDGEVVVKIHLTG
jgi:deazaflavin-dependent oxidoreductase (nitroreductase family)